MDKHRNTVAIQAVANALGDMRPEVVFVGGATIGLYATKKTAAEPRVTEDVDCIIELASYAEFAHLEERLRGKGFRNDQASGIQIRWLWQQYTVDVMPTNEQILGFSNPWYESGLRTAVAYELPDKSTIQLLNGPHLLATKFCAMLDRGEDLRYSPDFEDILYLLTYRADMLAEVADSLPEVRSYVSKCCAQLLSRQDIREIIDAAKDRDVTVSHLLRQLQHLARNSG